MNKIKMELTWNDCELCPPEEDYVPNILVTNGLCVAEATYMAGMGYHVFGEMKVRSGKGLWWTDLEQAVGEVKEFFV